MPAQTLFNFSEPPTSRSRVTREEPLRAIRPTDLHIHSPHSARVSDQMVLENIVPCAWRKGLGIVGTGDCLQPAWRQQIAHKLVETGSGLLALRPEFEAACRAGDMFHCAAPLHFLLSTEVSCLPAGMPYASSHHHLIYFRSLDSIQRFQERIRRYGDLTRGRPILRLTSRQLLEHVVAHGEGTELAPAHIVSPILSSLGSTSAARSLQDVFGDLAPRLLAIEMGLTSIPPMCRRLSSLDGHALFACSDAHSLEMIGREYMLLDVELTYDSVMNALRARTASRARICVKMPVKSVEGYWNGCAACERRLDVPMCPRCGRPASIGSRDQVTAIADRAEDCNPVDTPFVQRFPLKLLLARLMKVREVTQEVQRMYRLLLAEIGHERHILTESPYDELAAVHTAEFARAICAQRA